jgi:hypothetical protein
MVLLGESENISQKSHTVGLSISVRDRQTHGRTHKISHTRTVLLNLVRK